MRSSDLGETYKQRKEAFMISKEAKCMVLKYIEQPNGYYYE
jgi:hypothetical protein